MSSVRRFLVPFCVGVLLVVSLLAVLTWPAPQASAQESTISRAQISTSPDVTAAVTMTWTSERVDAPAPYQTDRGNQTLQLDSSDNAHTVVGADHLYHLWYDGVNWQNEPIDEQFGVGRYASLSLDSNDDPHVAYSDRVNGNIKYATWGGSQWERSVVDTGSSFSIAVDSSDSPHIAYRASPSGTLNLATWSGSNWHSEVVDSKTGGATAVSLVLDSGNNPHISYVDSYSGTLMYATWTGASWHTEGITNAIPWEDTSIGLDADDRPIIAYTEDSSGQVLVKAARWSGSAWEIQTVDPVDYTVGLALRVDSSGDPHMAYYASFDDGGSSEAGLKFATWTGSAWSVEFLQALGSQVFPSVAIDSQDKARITYGDWSVHLATATDADWTFEKILDMDHAGAVSSIALDSSDDPHMGYYSTVDRSLKYATHTGTAWISETVDTGIYGGSVFPDGRVSLALDKGDIPHLAYQDEISRSLKYATQEGGGWYLTTVDDKVGSGSHASIALDSIGNAHVSYDVFSFVDELRYATNSGGNWITDTVDSQLCEFFTESTAIAIDSSDRPHIAYFGCNWSNYEFELRYASWNGSSWEIEVPVTQERTGNQISLALDAADRPHISYRDNSSPGSVKYLHWNGTVWEHEIVDDYFAAGSYGTAIALDANDRPVIAYSGSLSHVYLAQKGQSDWSIEEVESAAYFFPSLALDGHDNPHISGFDVYFGDLIYATGQHQAGALDPWIFLPVLIKQHVVASWHHSGQPDTDRAKPSVLGGYHES